jgi:carboxymethylenebutenolidase
VVVIQHRTGVDEFIQEMVRRFVAEGYVSIAPELYHREASSDSNDPAARSQRLRDVTIIQDVNTAIEYLKKHQAIRGQRIGIVGFCQGGRVSYLMASINQDLKAAVDFYGGNAMRALGDGPSPFERSKEIVCPFLGLFGLDDQNPSPDDVKKFDAELTRWGKAHEFHSYEGAGHAFMDFSSASYREGPARDGWTKTLAWFSKHLVGAKVTA